MATNPEFKEMTQDAGLLEKVATAYGMVIHKINQPAIQPGREGLPDGAKLEDYAEDSDPEEPTQNSDKH